MFLAKDLKLMIDNIGLPARVFNLAFTDGSAIGVNDGVIQIELSEHHQPTEEITKKLRAELSVAFPDVLFYFQPADLVTQVLNFGVPTQIDVQIQGRDRENNAKQRRASTAKNGRGSRHSRRACPARARRAGNVLHGRPHARPAASA